MLPKNNKKRRKKNQISNPAISNGGNEKKKKKKRKSNMQNLSCADMCQRGGSFPPFQMAGMRKTTKKNEQK